jgi:tripartite-type tricarboxylate transporter receptor subunit TctC
LRKAEVPDTRDRLQIDGAETEMKWLKFAMCVVTAGVGVIFPSARADQYPSSVITIVVPFPAGGATDAVARVTAQQLSERAGRQVIVENKPGANGMIGSSQVAKAKPDGYALVMGGVNTHAMNDSLFKKRPYDSSKDFEPITLTARIPIAIVVHPSLQVSSLPELVDLARRQPGKLSYGSSGAGGPHHLAMELFKITASADLVHVAYKGGAPQLTDLLGGHIKVGVIGLPPALPHIQAGKLRALAVTESKRSSFLPEVPTVVESGFPGFEVTYWLGLLAPAGTQREIVNKLNKEVVEILSAPGVREQLNKQGAEVITCTPEEFGALIKAEIPKWYEVIKQTGATAE